MPPKWKNRPAFSSSSLTEFNNSPDEKQSRAECCDILEALNMAENLGSKIEEILKKLGKLDIIESQRDEMHAKIINTEVGRLDTKVKSLKNKTKKLKKNVEELEDACNKMKMLYANYNVATGNFRMTLMHWRRSSYTWRPTPDEKILTIKLVSHTPKYTIT